jgi:hypothetical protein
MEMKNLRKLFLFALFIVSVVIVSQGCSKNYLVGFDSQSHFDFPNSDVLPLGHVVGEASKTSVFEPLFLDGDLKEAAIKNALSKQSSADLLLNYVTTQTYSNFFIFQTLTCRVEGTAAQMNVIRKTLTKAQ